MRDHPIPGVFNFCRVKGNSFFLLPNHRFTQDDIEIDGHAIEFRINAEDPSKNFQPCPGTIGVCHQPSGFRTRVDGSIFQGCKITPYYDSLIAKVICKGRIDSQIKLNGYRIPTSWSLMRIRQPHRLDPIACCLFCRNSDRLRTCRWNCCSR